MNLIDIYLKDVYLEGYGILSRVKLSTFSSARNNSCMIPGIELEQNKVYSVWKIKKCTGTFKCAKDCTTNCHSVMVDVWDERQQKMIHVNTCGYTLLLPSGKPVAFNK